MKSTDELDKLGIHYEVRRHGMVSASATEAAKALGLPLESIAKTLVLVGRTIGPIIVLVPGDRRLDLIILRQELRDTSLHLASREQTLEISGYPVGLVTPFGLKQKLPIYYPRVIELRTVIAISCGESGGELLVTTDEMMSHKQFRPLSDACTYVLVASS